MGKRRVKFQRLAGRRIRLRIGLAGIAMIRGQEKRETHKEARVLCVSLNSFNVLNHRNDVTYIGTITSKFFGRAVAAQPPRRMQLDLQFKF